MTAKYKTTLRPPGKLPMRYQLSLGNKSTKYNDLTWEAACKVAKGFDAKPDAWQKLHVEMTVSHAPTPHTPMKYEDQPDPCSPGAVKRAIKRATQMVSDGTSVGSWVTGKMRYTAGGDQYGHHAMWDLGYVERDDGALARAGKRRRR